LFLRCFVLSAGGSLIINVLVARFFPAPKKGVLVSKVSRVSRDFFGSAACGVGLRLSATPLPLAPLKRKVKREKKRTKKVRKKKD
jgi:hypothetical protein